jgi:hypothetical protein
MPAVETDRHSGGRRISDERFTRNAAVGKLRHRCRQYREAFPGFTVMDGSPLIELLP